MRHTAGPLVMNSENEVEVEIVKYDGILMFDNTRIATVKMGDKFKIKLSGKMIKIVRLNGMAEGLSEKVERRIRSKLVTDFKGQVALLLLRGGCQKLFMRLSHGAPIARRQGAAGGSFSRMVKLSEAISYVIMDDFGPDELVRRLADPNWFQALSCAVGYDWHSSGTTTVTMGALKEALNRIGRNLHSRWKGKGWAQHALGHRQAARMRFP
jgi:hypothetical protein